MKKYKIKDNILWRIAGNQVLVLNKDKGQFFRLKGISFFIWLELEKGNLIEDFTSKIMKEYDVSLNKLNKDLELIFEKWLKEGLICQK